MSEPSKEEATNELIVALMGTSDSLDVLLDSAEGFKAKMEARGWGPAAAESAAILYLNGLIASAMGIVSPPSEEPKSGD